MEDGRVLGVTCRMGSHTRLWSVTTPAATGSGAAVKAGRSVAFRRKRTILLVPQPTTHPCLPSARIDSNVQCQRRARARALGAVGHYVCTTTYPGAIWHA
eukprot:scaffold119983_cov42-Tisochrysis_lutea.AAC.2